MVFQYSPNDLKPLLYLYFEEKSPLDLNISQLRMHYVQSCFIRPAARFNVKLHLLLALCHVLEQLNIEGLMFKTSIYLLEWFQSAKEFEWHILNV